MIQVLCMFCGQPINEDRDYQKVTGWEKRRSQGGTNALRLREPHAHVWACSLCIDRMSKGVAARQGSLI